MNAEKQVTEWNSSLDGLKRLNKYLDLCNELSILSKSERLNYKILQQWKLTILSVKREISTKMEKEDLTKINKTLKKYSKIKPIIQTKNTPQGKIKKIHIKNFNQYWNLNNQLETKLRKIADDKGMLITDKVIDDINKAIRQNR